MRSQILHSDAASPRCEPDSADETLLTVRQVAERLNLAINTVYALAAAGQMPSIRINRTLRVSPNLLLRWLEEKTRV